MVEKDYLKDISEIRSIMERSSRFISLSGLSGVIAGIYALAGAYVAQLILRNYHSGQYSSQHDALVYLLLDAALVLILAISTGIFLTTQRAKKQGLKIWDMTAKRLLINLMIPLVTGGLFIIVLLIRGYMEIIAPAMLIFYGLSLVNASKYTFSDVRYLGIAELVLGLVSAVMIGHGLLFWTIGFSILHIVYGILMYYKYER